MRILIILVLGVLFFFNIDKIQGSCVFCTQEIVEKQSVFQSTYFHILLDYQPRVEGHLLVVPKRHLVKAHELCQEEWAELSTIIPKIVKGFTECLHTDQYIILEKNGPNAFQHIPHAHFQLFPITSQTWAEIFNIVPEQLSQEAFDEQIALLRSYFSSLDS